MLSFLTAADYEEQASYSIVVTASDGENSVDQTITVSLNDVNDTCPTITSPSTYSADENQTVIGNITVDSACTNIIFEIAGTDQNLLTVNNLTGALAFVNAPDFESKNQFSAIAKATDGNNNVSQKAIAISVNNLNDNFPVITSSNSRNMDEGETAVITVNATDADDSSDPGFTNFSYTINGVDANFFSIDGAGNIVFSSSSDFETQSNYSITVNVSDGLNITSQAISVSLNDLNDEVPVFTSASSWTIDENNTIVGSVTATDQDANSTLSYSISGGDDAGAFILNANNGTLEFATAPDYETKTSYNLEVTVSDGANTASQNITVAVNNLDDNDPIFTSPSTINVNENESFIGTLTATDADGDTITFGAPTEAALIIDEITGDISWSPSILSNDNLSNYEWYQRNNAGLPYSFQVKAYAGQSTVTMILTINVLNVNEAPERLSGGVKDCGLYQEETVTDLNACIYDDDGDTLSYTLTGGTDSSVINITSNGIVSVGGDLADFENPLDVNGDNIYEYQVNVSDGQLSTLLNITDTIANMNDNRAYVNPQNITINENQKWNILDLKPLVIDADGLPEVSSAFPGSWSFGLCGGLDQNKFNLYQFDPDDEFSNDRVQFIDKPNYENPHDSNSDNIYEFDIKVADGGGFGPCNPMTVTVENINETPTFSYQNEHPTTRRNFYQLRMDENQTGVTFEGSANGIYNDVTDEEGDTLSFTIEGIEEDSGINRFSANSSGIISWNESGLPNYEMQNPPRQS